MIVTTLYLAAAEASTDPWHVLGSTYDDRLAIALLADLTLARCLRVASAERSESPAARRVELAPDVSGTGPLLGAGLAALRETPKVLDVDRAIRQLGKLVPAIEAALVARGELVEGPAKGLLRKRSSLTVRPGARAEAQARICAASACATPADQALALIAVTSLSIKRMTRLCGTRIATRCDPFDAFDPAAAAPDGRPLGDNAADLLTTLCTVLAAIDDTTDHMPRA